MNKKAVAIKAVEALKSEYPDAICSLVAEKPYELLFATRLSAQCTDARVNLITPALFGRYKTLEEYASADLNEMEDIVRPCGFFHTKAKDIIDMSKVLLEKFNGIVPNTIEELITLPGVGRKTANLICGDVYGKPAVVADTHLIRLSNRLGLVNTKYPDKVENELKKILPPEESNDFCHRCVLHGRAVCTARKAKCDDCVMNDFCPKKL